MNGNLLLTLVFGDTNLPNAHMFELCQYWSYVKVYMWSLYGCMCYTCLSLSSKSSKHWILYQMVSRMLDNQVISTLTSSNRFMNCCAMSLMWHIKCTIGPHFSSLPCSKPLIYFVLINSLLLLQVHYIWIIFMCAHYQSIWVIWIDNAIWSI